MVYRKRPAYNKKRKPRPSRFKTYSRAGVQLYRDVKYLKGIINAEVKNHYVDINQNVTSTGVIHALSSIIQGDTQNQRDGAKIFPRWLQIRGTFRNTNTDDTIRCLVFRWAENSVPTVATVLYGTPNPHSFYAETVTGNKVDRTLNVLFDDRWNFVQGTNNEIQEKTMSVDINPSTSNRKLHIEYDNPAVGTPVMNGIYMLLIGTQAAGANEGFSLVKTKLSYYDN